MFFYQFYWTENPYFYKYLMFAHNLPDNNVAYIKINLKLLPPATVFHLAG